MFNSFYRYKAEKYRQLFIRNCIANDTPRLEEEVFPSGCRTEMDVVYQNKNRPLKLDVYTPDGCHGAKECFVLIHGGAFVYGFKKLDQNFGMHLAIRSGIPVVNVDYTLMPEATLSDEITEIFKAMNHVYIKYGFKTFHTVGDSAGAYLAYVTAAAARNRRISDGLIVTERLKGSVMSAALICPSITNQPGRFPAIYFEDSTDVRRDKCTLPKYAYDLRIIATLDKDLRVALVTGEDDFLCGQTRDFKDHLKAPLYYEAVNEGDRKMHHVFPIAHPEWPESVKAIDLIAQNALGKK